MKLKKLAPFHLSARKISFVGLFLLSSAICGQINDSREWVRQIETIATIDHQNNYQIEAFIKTRTGIFDARVFYSSLQGGPFQEISMSTTDGEMYTCNISFEETTDALYYYIEATSNSGMCIKNPLSAPAKVFILSSQKSDDEFSARVTSEYGKLKVFPNPAREHVWIAYSPSSFDNEFHILTLRIYDPYGKTFLEKKLTTDESQFMLNISKLAAGNYFILLHDEWGRFMSEKLIIH